MNSILSCFIILFISATALAQINQPTCRNGANGCSSDLDCQTYTSSSSYCMNYPPHTFPYVCHGCGDGTGCCALGSTTPPCPNNNNLIVNGGFEVPICNGGYCLFNNIDGWIVLQTGALIGALVEIDNTAFVCHSGSQCSDMASTGAVNVYLQTFATQPGNTYQLSFWEAANPDCSSSTISVSITASLFDSNGVLLATGTFPFTGGDSLTSPTNMGWTLQTFSFVATTVETTLLFTGTTQFSSCGPVLDDVSVTCTSV